MSNMRRTTRKAVMVLPDLEDIARLKRYAVEHALFNQQGAPNLAGAINEIASLELRRRYPELTAAEYKWCAAEQAKNEALRNQQKKGKKNVR